jgi:hypothetical protein
MPETPTPSQELNAIVETLAGNKRSWARTGIAQRRSLLRRAMDDTLETAPSMVLAACRAKGLDPDQPPASEEWLGGPMTIMRNLRLLDEVLGQIQRYGRPQLPERTIRRRADGQLAVEVFPRDSLEKLVFPGFRAEVWMDPGVDRQQMLESMASSYQQPEDQREGRVALVLGAGNVASIGPMDVLYKLFVENQVCVLKMNPVNDYLGPLVERAFAALIQEGVLRLAYGGAEVGEALVHHPQVQEVHITGSDRVHDIIVWGAPGEEQQRNREAGTPKIDKRITSELGCVTPVIVVPGQWSRRELEFQAANVATMVANNASFNCNAAKVLVTSRDWPQRKEFLDRVERVLASVPGRDAYYPGSDRNYGDFLASHPEARKLVPERRGSIPWTAIWGVDPEQGDDIVFSREAWCGVLAETALPGGDAAEFLPRAVAFANDRIWGTLSCVLLVDPRTQAALGPDFDRALSDLRYGSIGVNHWAALSYGMVTPTWGAYPGHTLEDIGSGIGVVHNALMFERPQKSVIYGPFVIFPTPPWFVTHKKAHLLGERLTRFEHDPSLWKFLGIAVRALRA